MRNWISRKDKSPRVVLAKSLMLTCAVDAHKRRDIMTLYIPYEHIHAKVPVKEVRDQILLKVRGDLVKWLCKIDPTSYIPFIVVERGVKILHLLVTKIFGMLQAGLLWYCKLRSILEEHGFVLIEWSTHNKVSHQ